MKYIKSYNQLNERISNVKLASHYKDIIKNKLFKKCGDGVKVINADIKRNALEAYYFEIVIDKKSPKKEAIKNYTIKIIENLNKKILNIGLFIGYDFYDWSYDFRVYIKDLYIKRFKPKRPYLYHVTSDRRRQSILKHGLKPLTGTKWGGELDYPPAVFASTGLDELFNYNYDLDVWRIDLSKIKNRWWMDLNMGDYYSAYVMTFDNIPPEALELVDKKEIRNIRGDDDWF